MSCRYRGEAPSWGSPLCRQVPVRLYGLPDRAPTGGNRGQSVAVRRVRTGRCGSASVSSPGIGGWPQAPAALRRQSERTQIAPLCSVVGYEKFFPVVAYNEADIARGASAKSRSTTQPGGHPRPATGQRE